MYPVSFLFFGDQFMNRSFEIFVLFFQFLLFFVDLMQKPSNVLDLLLKFVHFRSVTTNVMLLLFSGVTLR